MLGGVPRFPEHGPPRKPHIDPARRPDRFSPGGDVGHRDCRDSPRFDFAGDQTPGLVAQRSNRDEEGMGHSVVFQGGGNLRCGLHRHLVRPGAIADEAEDSRGQFPDMSVSHQSAQGIQGKGDIHIG